MDPAILSPFIRIALYALAGYLAGQDVDSWIVDFVRTDPQLLSACLAIVAGAWYGIAKMNGGKT